MRPVGIELLLSGTVLGKLGKSSDEGYESHNIRRPDRASGNFLRRRGVDDV
jgi:hypothetical protein